VRAVLLVAGAAAVPAVATLALPAVTHEKSGAGQGAAMLALLVVVAAAAALLARRPPGAATALPRLRLAAAGVLVLALAATAVAVSRVERQSGRDDPAASPGRLASVQSNRYAYWKVAVRAFGDHPVAGVGSGGFQAEWLRERPFREPVRDAHSLYLETPAELGLVGLALLLALIGSVAVAARRALPPYAGPVAALAAFALHAGVDWDWELPALSLVALVLAGLVLARSPARSAAPGGPAP
jgi:O-antigen ligase